MSKISTPTLGYNESLCTLITAVQKEKIWILEHVKTYFSTTKLTITLHYGLGYCLFLFRLLSFPFGSLTHISLARKIVWGK